MPYTLSDLPWRKDRIGHATTDDEAAALPAFDVLMACGRCGHEAWLPALVDQPADTITPAEPHPKHPCRISPGAPVAIAVRKVSIPIDPRTNHSYRWANPPPW